MYLEPSAVFNLGLIVFMAQNDIRIVHKLVVTIKNPDGVQLSLESEEACEHAAIEAELTLSNTRFAAHIKPEKESWKEFTELFFKDESKTISKGDLNFTYINKTAFNAAEICRMDFYKKDWKNVTNNTV